MKFSLRSKKNYSTLIILVVIALAAIFAFYAYRYFSAPPKLPPEFLTAYREVAEKSGNIVNFLNAVNGKIVSINELDLEGRTGEALRFIREARSINNKARDEALDLVIYLEELVNSFQNLSSVSQIKTAIETLQIQSQVVRDFLEYSEDLNKFLNTLSIAIMTNSFSDRLAVEEDINTLNKHRSSINLLNAKFLAKLQELEAR